MSKKKGPDSITLTYDLLKWSIPTLEKFPKSQRFLLGDRIENHILDVLELLICANYSKDKIDYLRKVNLKHVGWVKRSATQQIISTNGHCWVSYFNLTYEPDT